MRDGWKSVSVEVDVEVVSVESEMRSGLSRGGAVGAAADCRCQRAITAMSVSVSSMSAGLPGGGGVAVSGVFACCVAEGGVVYWVIGVCRCSVRALQVGVTGTACGWALVCVGIVDWFGGRLLGFLGKD